MCLQFSRPDQTSWARASWWSGGNPGGCERKQAGGSSRCRYLCPASLHFTAGATPHLAPASKNPFLCEQFVAAEFYGYDSEQCVDVMLLARSFLLERLSLLMPEWCLRSAIGPQPLVVSLQIICTALDTVTYFRSCGFFQQAWPRWLQQISP